MKVKRKTWFIGGSAIAVILIGVIVGVVLTRSDDTSIRSSDLATVVVGRGDILQTLTVYGKVVPKQEYTFTFNADRVNKIHVGVGQRVEPDQILVELDSTQQELSFLQAESALQDAQAEGIPVQIREKELSYEMAGKNLENATLRAPFAGVITRINQPTTSTENWSLNLIDTSELYIEAEVDQLDAPNVSVGQTARAVIEPVPDRTWLVEIVEVGGMAVARGNSTVVTITGKLPQTDESILVGYSAEMVITISEATDVLRVPISCLTQAPRGWMVTKVVGSEHAPTQVTIGVTSESFAEITSGLEEGDIVLLNLAGPATPQPSEMQWQRQPGAGFQGSFPRVP